MNTRVLSDLQEVVDLPEVFICARRAPAPWPEQDWLTERHTKVQERRFAAEPAAPSAFGMLQEVR